MVNNNLEELFLNDCWILYFHDPSNNDWSAKSYKVIHTISTVQDWIQVEKSFSTLWNGGMFFLMREHIQPMWEDPYNRSGGCLSFKVNKPEASLYWFHLGCKTIGETLCKNKEWSNKICGISISPKRNYCILRIWLSTPEINKVESYHLEAPHYTQIMYKPHAGQKDYDG